jgi:hypothetical protein
VTLHCDSSVGRVHQMKHDARKLLSFFISMGITQFFKNTVVRMKNFRVWNGNTAHVSPERISLGETVFPVL